MERREAIRVVLLDSKGQVAIINVQKHGYYKIPGGGIEPGETPQMAAVRETKEETGCNCEIIAELGVSETSVPDWNTFDISSGFLAKVIGEKQAPKLEEYEKERGFTLEWAPSLDKAIATIEANANITDISAAKLQARDLSFLKRAAAHPAKR